MALIGKVKFTQAVVEVRRSSGSETVVNIESGGNDWFVTGKGNGSQTKSLIVEQLVKQGYKIVATDGDKTTLQLEIPDVPEDAGPTAKFGVSGSGGSKCFIATACYGTEFHPHIHELRLFRENVLKPTRFGRKFVQIYEKLSPQFACIVSRKKSLRVIIGFVVVKPALSLVRLIAKVKA